MRIVAEFRADLGSIVAQEVNRFAHFGDGVGQRLAGFANDEAEQHGHARFESVRAGLQTFGAFSWFCGRPG